jgi:hypothetical protein
LALRIKEFHPPAVRWWSLTLAGSTVERIDGVYRHEPQGKLVPLLVSPADEVVAAVWISPDESMRQYCLPWMSTWAPIVDWLAQRAIPEFVPAAARRIHARLGEEPALQTTAELSARAALDQFDAESATRRAELEAAVDWAIAAADDVRHGLLFGTDKTLVVAVARVLTDSGCTVTDVDQLLGATINADLLVSHAGRHRLIEVKSASGNAGEKLVEAPRKHLATWPELQPQIPVEGITMVVNHQIRTHPIERSPEVYSRIEFVRALADIRVVSCVELHNLWRAGNFEAMRERVFTEAHTGSLEDSHDTPQMATPRRPWWRRRPTH